MTAFDICFDSILASEGGFVNDPRDTGGATNLGVTKRAWEQWVGHPVTIADIKSLTPAKAAPFYRSQYWNAAHCDSFPASLALCLFHCAVNSGPKRAATILQGIVGALPDGSIGPATLQLARGAIAVRGERAMVTAFQDAYRAYYRTLSNFDHFGKGWLNRARDVEQQALALAV
jgi:lysozyme family protein